MSSAYQIDLLFTLAEVMCQTLAYGAFIAIIPMTLYLLCEISKQGFRMRPNLVMLAITLFIFAMSTSYWAVSVMSLVSKITGSHMARNVVIREVFNAIVLINYIFADGVVVWRMRVLCKGQFSKVTMNIPIVMLGLTSVSIFVTIALRIAITAMPGGTVPKGSPLSRGIDTSQVVNLVLSLRYRITIVSNLKATGASAQIGRILTLLAESGVVYCASSIVLIIGAFVHIPQGTLGSVYTPIHTQLAGMYPAVIIILVASQPSTKSLASTSPSEENTSSTQRSRRMESLRFADGPDLPSQDHTASGKARSVILSAKTYDAGESLGTISEEDWEMHSQEGHQVGTANDWKAVQLDLV
ncbi:hypothetical protein BDW22DRAFT_1344497 [Trametopsis cervina]|nr:hypothetical protein BDW22DRAFT_1344497 [Trametopsis cervina]